MSEKETKFCNGTFECFGCPEQGEGNCYISGCPWVARFEEIKDKFAVAWFKREFHWIVKKVLKDIDDFEKSFNRPIEYYKINDHPTYLKLMRGKRFREMFGK